MNQLKQLRTQKGMTQDELSRASGISRITIARIEATGKILTMRVVKALAAALECTVDDLIGDPKGEKTA